MNIGKERVQLAVCRPHDMVVLHNLSVVPAGQDRSHLTQSGRRAVGRGVRNLGHTWGGHDQLSHTDADMQHFFTASGTTVFGPVFGGFYAFSGAV